MSEALQHMKETWVSIYHAEFTSFQPFTAKCLMPVLSLLQSTGWPYLKVSWPLLLSVLFC